jgi:hypothetical protein
MISSEVLILNQSITQNSKELFNKESDETSNKLAKYGFQPIANFSSSV